MRQLPVIAILLLCAIPAVAQEPVADPPKGENVVLRHVLFGGEALTPGFVWTYSKDEAHKPIWRQEQAGSCEWCAAPMTFRKAGTDRKALLAWGLVAGAMIVSTETDLRLPCIASHTCKELFGNNRPQVYGIKIGAATLQWVATTMLRKGNAGRGIGGMKHWWGFPVGQAVGYFTVAGIDEGLYGRR